jgi:hypothetical protein
MSRATFVANPPPVWVRTMVVMNGSSIMLEGMKICPLRDRAAAGSWV